MSPFHNGGYNDQANYGGKLGAISDVISKGLLNHPERVHVYIWLCSETLQSFMYGMIYYLKKYGFKYFTLGYTDVVANDIWSELSVGDKSNLGGMICTRYDSDYNHQYARFSDAYWNTKYQIVIFDSFETYNYYYPDNKDEELLKSWDFGNNTLIADHYDCDWNGFGSPCSMCLFNNYDLIRKKIKAKPKTEFILSVRAKGEDITTAIPYFSILWYDSDNKFIDENVKMMNGIENDAWIKFSLTSESPSNSKYAKILFHGSDNDVEKVYIDYVKLRMEYDEIELQYGDDIDWVIVGLIIGLSSLLILLFFGITLGLIFYFTKKKGDYSNNEIEMKRGRKKKILEIGSTEEIEGFSKCELEDDMIKGGGKIEHL